MKKLDDYEILSQLDEEWRAPNSVHQLMGYQGEAHAITSSLRRLAAQGSIKKKMVDTTVPKARSNYENPSFYQIEKYRKK